MRKYGLLLFTVLIVGSMIGLFALGNKGGGGRGQLNENIAGVTKVENLTREHTEAPVTYDTNPPMGGNHNPIWLDCNGKVYDESVLVGKAVHALEHGAVWLTYRSDLAADQVAVLKTKATGPYIFMSPLLDQPSPVTATAWGTQLNLDTVDDPRLADFIATYRSGKQTPEPGASCSDPEKLPR